MPKKDARYTVDVELKVWDDHQENYILRVTRSVPCPSLRAVRQQIQESQITNTFGLVDVPSTPHKE